jgi:hypothetical protein
VISSRSFAAFADLSRRVVPLDDGCARNSKCDAEEKDVAAVPQGSLHQHDSDPWLPDKPPWVGKTGEPGPECTVLVRFVRSHRTEEAEPQFIWRFGRFTAG